MGDDSAPHGMTRAPDRAGSLPGYMPGWANDFETEALPGALPQGMNSRSAAIMAFMASSFRAPPSPRPATRTSAAGAIASARR
jgi:homogentisate 1,2-dioxygenase